MEKDYVMSKHIVQNSNLVITK